MIKHKFVSILLIAWAFTVAHVSAQSQRGYAVIQNSNKKALPQVSAYHYRCRGAVQFVFAKSSERAEVNGAGYFIP